MRIRRAVLLILAVIITGSLVLSILGRAPAGGIEWTRGADLPVPRSEVAVAALGKEVYVIGGLGSRFEALDNVDIYAVGGQNGGAVAVNEAYKRGIRSLL